MTCGSRRSARSRRASRTTTISTSRTGRAASRASATTTTTTTTERAECAAVPSGQGRVARARVVRLDGGAAPGATSGPRRLARRRRAEKRGGCSTEGARCVLGCCVARRVAVGVGCFMGARANNTCARRRGETSEPRRAPRGADQAAPAFRGPSLRTDLRYGWSSVHEVRREPCVAARAPCRCPCDTFAKETTCARPRGRRNTQGRVGTQSHITVVGHPSACRRRHAGSW